MEHEKLSYLEKLPYSYKGALVRARDLDIHHNPDRLDIPISEDAQAEIERINKYNKAGHAATPTAVDYMPDPHTPPQNN